MNWCSKHDCAMTATCRRCEAEAIAERVGRAERDLAAVIADNEARREDAERRLQRAQTDARLHHDARRAALR